jgi:hypothetical protein
MNIVKSDFQYRTALTPLNSSDIKYLIIHHVGADISPEEIHQTDLDNGWYGASFNEYIRKNGDVCILRGDNVGAHCINYNSISYGICCEGDYDTEQNMPQAQFDSLIERLKFHQSRFSYAKIVGHGELTSTSCPGSYFPLQNVVEFVTRTQVGLKDALDFINAKACIDMDYWTKRCKEVPHLETLFIKITNLWKEGK